MDTEPDDLRQHLRAILAADAVGYSRLMAQDDRATLALLDQARGVFRREVERSGGRVVDTAGDSVLASFDSVGAALRAALAVQAGLDAALPFRIGLHLGDVIEKEDGSIYGDGVNIAARLQALAEPGGVLVSQAVHAIVATRQLASFDDLGEHTLKNVAQPVRVWSMRRTSSAQPAGNTLRFGRFEIQPLERRLLVDGQPAVIGARAFDLLLALSSQPGALLTKSELLDVVWPGLVVEENNLATQISTLRKLLGGDVIVTIPGRGYRFAARAEAGAAGEPAASPASASLAAASQPEVRLKTNLPHPLPALLGRQDDVAALGALIEQHPLVSIVGAGGMGKSLLTQHLLNARRGAYPHGVCWVELATVTDPAQLPGAVAAALDVQLSGTDALAGLCNAVAPLQILVALDNVEQVLDGAARMVAALLAAAPGLRLVVTSQAPLKLGSERVYRIGALAVPQGPLPAAQALAFGAVSLFVERAQAADARFALTDDNVPHIIELCRALDGLALAIELAAARAPMLGVQRLATSMHDRLKLLTSSRNRAAPARQQTLRAALEWSHGLLDERERAVFRRLAVFAGSGSLTMIQQVVADPPGPPGESELDEWAVLDVLASLVDRSLVTVMAAGDAAEPRYRLLDSPRAFALEQLRAVGEEPALRDRHMHAMAAHCEASWHWLYSGEIGKRAWQEAMDLDADNASEAMVQAVARGDRVAALRIGALRMRAANNLPLAQRRSIIELCAELVDDTVPPALQVRVWMYAAGESLVGGPVSGVEVARRALTLVQHSAELQGDAHRRLRYFAWACFAKYAHMSPEHRHESGAALAQARELEDPHWPPHVRLWLAEVEYLFVDGGGAELLQRTRECLAIQLAAGDTGYNARANLIDAELAAGDAQAAVHTGEALLADLQGRRAEVALAYTFINVAAAKLALCDVSGARMLAQRGWPHGRQFVPPRVWADYLALLSVLEDRPAAAARLAGYADTSYSACGQAREFNELNAYERASTLARAVLGDAEFERLHAEGKLLGDAQIEAIAFATADS